MNKQYLGDGLYAEFDGFQIRLYTVRGSGIHEVFLEPQVLDAFLSFTQKIRGQQ